MLVNDAPFEAIVPEGSDDFEIQTPNGSVLVDTKSNRPNARDRSASENSASIRKLWTRAVKIGAKIDEYWLVVERASGVIDGKVEALALFPKPAPPQATKSYLAVERDPWSSAITLLAERRGLTPLAAELVVLAFAREVGRLADTNGPLPLEDRVAIAATDAEHLASRVLSAVDVERLERIIRQGVLTPVDFTTPINDEGFFLGVDVQPGHFAAGLALDRPDAASKVREALLRTGVVVITGQSGAGKSGLMWNAVIKERKGRRWFKVSAPELHDTEALSAFFAAYQGAPVGLVVDDIGRGKLEIWKALRPLCAAHPNVFLIGSTRTEDAPLLPDRHTIVEVQANADQVLAKSLWTELHQRGQTEWSGWKEPWEMSEGLLLEYSHILTQKQRLYEVLLDQVRVRLAEHRDNELAILNASAPIAANGGTVAIETLREQLKLSRADIARALERLIAEHLVRTNDSGSELTGLHSLRAKSICMAMSSLGFSTPYEQAAAAIASTHSDSIESVVRGLIATSAIDADTAAAKLVGRLKVSSSLPEAVGAIRGLRGGVLALSARAWLEALKVNGVPRKFATMAAMFGLLPPDSMPDIGNIRLLTVQGRTLFEEISGARLPPELASALVTVISSSDTASAADYVDALTALAQAQLTVEQLARLTAARPPLESFSIPEIVDLLDAAESVAPALSAAWAIRKPGQNAPDLLSRLIEETPFALPFSIEETDEGLTVHADIYEAAVPLGDSPNDRLVHHCHSIMRLAQGAQVAHVRLVDATGNKSLHMDAEKRMPRSNLLPHGHTSANRRIVDAVALEVGIESWSAYLSRGATLAKRGFTAFRRFLDSALIGKVDQTALTELNDVVGACDDLVAPASPPNGRESYDTVDSGRHLTPLQNTIFKMNAALALAVAQLPKNAVRLASNAHDLLDTAESAKKEPWDLIADGAPEVLSDIGDMLNMIELTALEAAAANMPPQQRWPKTGRKPKGAFDLIARGSRRAFAARIEARSRSLESCVGRELAGARIVPPTAADGIMWASRFVASFPVASLEDFKAWIVDAGTVGRRISADLKEGEDICLVPMIKGQAAADYSYRLSHADPTSMVAAFLDANGQLNLLCAPDQALLDRLAIPVLKHPPAMERVFLAARDLNGMNEFEFGTESRPLVEREHRAQALELLANKGPDLIVAFSDVEHPSLEAFRRLSEYASSAPEVPPPSNTELSVDGLQDLLVVLLWKRAG
ncbi:hypothetical protein [Maricaulis salignorans]|uniref:hypothetical protein n=1 Tax=Maricaulis salignorans TaxID=144026 RepID=UPI003A8D9715